MQVKACKQFNIRGRVQGVGYRYYTVRQAEKLGVTGSVSNLPDGSVEVIACAEKAALEAFEDWLHEGPPGAAVTEVSGGETSTVPQNNNFEIR